MTIEQLNNQFAIDGYLRFIEGDGGFPFVEVNNGKGTAIISVYAGQVLSYRPAGETEDLLFLSKLAYYQDGKAIKGGVPVCWPWFGPDPEGQGRPGHGFVRNRYWQVIATEATSDGAGKVTLGLQNSEETFAIWPNAFELTIEITVSDSLTVELVTRNNSEHQLPITQGLHTYFNIGDIDKVQVQGLEDTEYLDKADQGQQRVQQGPVTVTSEVDRIYLGVDRDLVIDDAALGRRVRIASRHSNTAVVWNPWKEIAASMGDLEDDDYRRFICVETTNADEDVAEIGPGEEYRLMAQYRIERD